MNWSEEAMLVRASLGCRGKNLPETCSEYTLKSLLIFSGDELKRHEIGVGNRSSASTRDLSRLEWALADVTMAHTATLKQAQGIKKSTPLR